MTEEPTHLPNDSNDASTSSVSLNGDSSFGNVSSGELSGIQPDDLAPTERKMTKEYLTEQFTLHRERLWRTVQIRMDARLYGRVDAEDVLQEAYLDAVKRIGHFAEEQNYSPFVWIRMVVCQTLINVHRRHIGTQKRDATRERSMGGARGFQLSATSQSIAIHLAASQTSPSQAAVNAEAVEELAAKLDVLSDIDREVLTLRHFEDLTNKEVAELLNIDQKTASIRYVRAVQRLKKCMENTDFDASEI